MAWDAPRRCGPLPHALGRSHFCVDELDFHRNALDKNNSKNGIPNMQGQLSPIQEERRFPSSDAPLQIHVTAKFHDPAIRFAYSRSYHSSQSFTPTEQICRGLLRRIQHCSEEVITRKDSDALNPTQCLRKGLKPLRFELNFQVVRAGYSGIWAETSFKSFKKHALTSAAAKEVLRATHRIVGLFMRRHDKGFEWTDEPAYDHFPDKPETFKPSPDGTLNLACVPRSLFIESHQTWEFVPGYFVELTFKSSNPARRQINVEKTLWIDSGQNTPLNLGLGEDLLWQAHRFLQGLLDQKKSSFDLEHANCDGFDGVPDCDCQHFDAEALNVGLRVVNNLGPVYDHLQRSTQSRLRLFTHSSGQDCDDFVRKLHVQLNQLKEQTDKKVGKLNDFDFRIAEFTGHGWHEKNCARFIIGGERNHSRPIIQALLDRIRTGVSDILRGNDVAIRMIAYKRGHLVLDKALVARDHQSTPGSVSVHTAENQRQSLLEQLKLRIQHDIDIVCKDTCTIDDIPEVGLEARQRDFFHSHPASSTSRPFTPCGTPQRQIRPGSPANFATRPLTPPEVPTRSSSRVFLLVPAKHQAEKKWRGKAPSSASVRDSAVGVSGNGSFHSSVVGVEASHILKNEQKGTNRVNEKEALKPAAEVYPALKEEYETDSNSTHSSMPALTESDTPSPEQSVFITPSCVRASSPVPHRLPSTEDLRGYYFSSPFVINASAPNSIKFSDVDHVENSNNAVSEKTAPPSGRPGTPEDPQAGKSAHVNTPKALGDVVGDEKTPVPHRSVQGPDETSELGDRGNGLVLKHIAAGPEPLTVVSQSLSTERSSFCHKEEDFSSENPSENHGENEVPESVTECDSSKTVRPSTVVQQSSIDGLVTLGDIATMETRSCILAPVSELSYPKVSEEASNAQHSVPTGQSRLNSEDSGEDGLRAMTIDDELSRSKIDFFEQDDDSAIDSEARGDASRAQTGLRRMGMSERSESTAHVIPFSDSGIDIKTGSETIDTSGSESEEKHVLSPIDESAFEFDVDLHDSTVQALQASLTEPEQESPSESWVNDDVRRGNELLPANTKDSTTIAVEMPESPSEGPESAKKRSTPDPTQASDPVKLPRVRISGPASTARIVSNPQPSSPIHIGSQLLPSLPIFSARRSVSHDTRASWSTSSSWEDYVSSCRQSSDSVDTIKASPASSEKDDPPGSPKRLGTPTAGLLGLHESRWAEFGIRTALTGSHVFDRPSTAPVPESLESTHHDVEFRSEVEHANGKVAQESSTSPRKSFHLKQKKSIGSIVMASKSKRKESKELRKQKSVELRTLKKIRSKLCKEHTTPREDDDSAARFPRAMMLVAGLAFASSVVSRSHP